MRSKIHKVSLLVVMVGAVIFIQSCMPNVARTNAKIKDGWSGGGAATVNYAKDESVKNSDIFSPQIDGNLQYGIQGKYNFGFAAQLKGTMLGTPAALDLYVEGPSGKYFYYGVGVEVGFANAAYMIGTFYPSEYFYISLTARLVDNWAWGSFSYNPQLSVGWKHLIFIVGYNYYPDKVELDLDIDGYSDTRLANHVINAGVGVNF